MLDKSNGQERIIFFSYIKPYDTNLENIGVHQNTDPLDGRTTSFSLTNLSTWQNIEVRTYARAQFLTACILYKI